MFKDQPGKKIKVRVIKTASSFDQPTAASQDKDKGQAPFEQHLLQPPTKTMVSRDFSKNRPKKSKKILFFIIFFLLLISGATVAGFFIFGRPGPGSSNRVDLKIQAPFEISSGEEIEYLVEIKNKEVVALEKINLLLQYPFGFEYQSATVNPVNETKNSFPLPDLAAGQDYQLTVKGRLVGEVNETKNIEAILDYQPANFNSNFQIKKTALSLIKDSIIGLTLDYPPTIIDSQSFLLKIKYKNNQPTDQQNVRLVLEPADGFIIETTSTTPVNGEWYWQKDWLAAGQEEEILVKGHFDKTAAVSNKITVKVGFMENEALQVITYQRVTLSIINPAVEFKLTLNDQENLAMVNWNEELNYKISIKNNSSDFTIPQANLQLKLPVALLDKNSLQEDNGAVWTTEGLVWGESSKIWQDFLQDLAPGKEKEIGLKVKIIGEPADLTDYLPSQLIIEAAAQITSPALSEDFILTSNKITTTIGAGVEFSAKAFYYLNKDIQVGSGPVPPQVGEKTNYKIYWYLNPGNNNLKDMVIKAILPPDVNWERNSQVTAGTMEFDESSRQITWNLEELLMGDLAQGYFFVSITPTASQVGQVITLLNPSTLSAQKDQETITQTKDSLDTNLEFDPVKVGQGVVVE